MFRLQVEKPPTVDMAMIPQMHRCIVYGARVICAREMTFFIQIPFISNDGKVVVFCGNGSTSALAKLLLVREM